MFDHGTDAVQFNWIPLLTGFVVSCTVDATPELSIKLPVPGISDNAVIIIVGKDRIQVRIDECGIGELTKVGLN